MSLGAFIDRHGVGRWLLNFGLIIAVVVGVVVWGNHWSRHEDAKDMKARYDFCVKLEQVRTYARDAASRGLKSVPTLTYYRNHPRERVDAVKTLKGQVRFFSPPLDCKKFAKELTN